MPFQIQRQLTSSALGTMFGTGAIAYAKLGGSKPAGSNVPPPVEKDTSIQATSKEEEDL
jgi:hypothetical protein